MVLRRYFASDVSEQIALRNKDDQEGPSLDLLLDFEFLMLSESAAAWEIFHSEFPMPPLPPRHIKHYCTLIISICISIHPGSRVDNFTCQLNISSHLATAQGSHEHLPITALSCKCLISLKSTLMTTIKKNSFSDPRRSPLVIKSY
jgi:hypothetical protein